LEKLNPADKCWQVVKHARYVSNNLVIPGYKVRVGDTLKFGRVRFKVIMMHTESEGEQVFNFKKQQHEPVSIDSQDKTESD